MAEEIEEGMGKYMAWVFRSPHSEVADEKEFLRVTSDVPDPFCNFLLRLHFDERNIESRMKDMMRFFESRQLPTSCWIGPCSGPPTLGKYLAAQGFVLHKNLESTGMTIDLDSMNEDLPMPEDIVIKRVANEDDFRQHLAAFKDGFEFPEASASCWGRMNVSHGFDASLPRVDYVATIDGVPASCTTLFKTPTAAGIYCVATVKPMRRRGAATALIITALRDAKREGYKLGLLTAKAMSASVYRRIGFVDQPYRFDWYTWQPANHPRGPT